ncbi:MAG: T6SS phospholipase effector Tle1-like catalytic domain-containing protein [Novosphingobium sp.]
MSLASPCAVCEQQAAWSDPVGSFAPTSPSDTQLSEKPTQRVRIALFFDGTMNNKTNTKARQAGVLPDNIWKAETSEKVSYLNDLSNVARMYDASPNTKGYKDSSGVTKAYTQFTPIYIEGIGTENLEPPEAGKTWKGPTDSTKTGGAFGTGSTGIVDRVRKGIDQAITKIKSGGLTPEFDYIHFDVFGFSRGAAGARHCIHALHSGWAIGDYYFPGTKSRLEMADAKIGDLKVRFAGLYDTVASLGVIHINDTWELSLDAVSQADQVMHIAAAEEHRVNFRLTSIGSGLDADDLGAGSFEVFLPGVHCDIGGSYNSPTPQSAGEEKLVFWRESVSGIFPTRSEQDRQKEEYDWLINQGWCSGPENLIKMGKIDSFPGKTFYVAGIRAGRINEYCLIPLGMMIEYSNEQGLMFSNNHSVSDSYLRDWQTKLKNYAKNKRASGGSKPEDWFHRTDQDLPTLRAKYLHFSAYYNDLSEAATWTSAAVDLMLEPMAPEYNGRRRARKIQ